MTLYEFEGFDLKLISSGHNFDRERERDTEGHTETIYRDGVCGE